MRIILCGCCGRMGRAVAAAVAERHDMEIVAGIDPAADSAPLPADFPVFSCMEDCAILADVIVDFSAPAALEAELAYAVARKLPVVVATTGLTAEQTAALEGAAAHIPVFYSRNMSLGVAVLKALTQKAAAVLGDDFDVEILEMHHNQKVDAPSGTALALAEAAKAGLSYEPEPVYDRHERRQKRSPHEIGIASLRGGNIVGEHQVLFAGQNETVILTHRAQSREVFAVGALRAARFIAGKPAGLYHMEDLTAEL